MPVFAYAKIATPEDVEISVTISLPVGRWEEFLHQGAALQNYPARTIIIAVKKAVENVKSTAMEPIVIER